MEDSNFRRVFFRLKNIHIKVTLCEAREWLLKICLLKKLVPSTLRPKNRDPRPTEPRAGAREPRKSDLEPRNHTGVLKAMEP